MRTKQKRKSWTRRLVVPAITIPCLAYFVMQSQSGRYGIDSGREMQGELATKTDRYARLLADRQALEQRVRLLSDGTLERDMIDERARRSLNLSNEDEVTILLRQ